ncbi:MAG: alpha/beta fold hydrolase, partial [Verrucomicrobiales bacterium]|nr:alpha/beta fold hydrolase [Verrucomicrobiales bacterium]
MIFRSALVSVALGVGGLGVMLARQAERDMPITLQLPTHRVRAVVRGTGSPTVVLEAFGSAPAELWNRISRDVAEFAPVFSYDHAGHWGSEPGPKPRDARQIAMELHAALAAAGRRPPYLLVGYSFGGPYTRVFADLYPSDVAGLVLVDPT